jgi:hypothetical protein
VQHFLFAVPYPWPVSGIKGDPKTIWNGNQLHFMYFKKIKEQKLLFS